MHPLDNPTTKVMFKYKTEIATNEIEPLDKNTFKGVLLDVID